MLMFNPVATAQGLALIRDAEIENTIRSYSTPLFAAAGLDANAVDVYLVNDKRLNAFVAGGMNLFINTGLLQASDTPGEVIGVIAHETGHIAGGHLARTHDAIRGATAEAILAYILGAAVMATGASQAGAAIMGAGGAIAQGTLIRYTQTQEQAADQAAVRYLEATEQSAEGLLDMFGRLEDQELLVAARQDPYVRSHPLTRERIRFVENHVQTSQYSGQPESPARLERHSRMVAKLRAFLETPARALKAFPASDNSLEARYGRAIAYYRIPDLSRALAELDSLLVERPDDPYFHELKGQILFENGRVAEAIAPYQQAVRLRGDEPLLRLGLARAQIETGEPALNRAAIEHLREAVRIDPTYAPYLHFLGIAYGRDGQIALSSLALAEEALLRGDLPKAKVMAERAKDGLPSGSPPWLRAADIVNAAESGS